jgi:voltage-gated potassium channel
MKVKRYIRFLIILIVSLTIYFVLLKILINHELLHPDAGINSWKQALWWSITTLTTVGYGDLVPITTVGRVIGFIFLIASFSIYAILIGLISSIMNKLREEKRLGYHGIKWKHHAVIIGWSKFGHSVTQQLLGAGKKIVIVTNQKDAIDFIHENYPPSKVFGIHSELKTPEILEKINIGKSSAVFVNLDSDTEKLVFILNTKKAFAGLNYIVTLDNADLKPTLLEAGATYVLSKTEIAAKLLASYIFEPDVALFNEEIIAVAEDEQMYDMKQYRVTKENPYNGMYYEKIFYDIKKECNAILVGLVQCEDGGKKLIKNPDTPITVTTDDYLLMLINGKTEKLVDKMFQVKEGYAN